MNDTKLWLEVKRFAGLSTSIVLQCSLLIACDFKIEEENSYQKKLNAIIREFLGEQVAKKELSAKAQFSSLPISSSACLRSSVSQSDCANIVVVASNESEALAFVRTAEQLIVSSKKENVELIKAEGKYVSFTYGLWKDGVEFNITPYGVSKGLIKKGDRLIQL
jgi:hypothetical protein